MPRSPDFVCNFFTFVSSFFFGSSLGVTVVFFVVLISSFFSSACFFLSLFIGSSTGLDFPQPFLFLLYLSGST